MQQWTSDLALFLFFQAVLFSSSNYIVLLFVCLLMKRSTIFLSFWSTSGNWLLSLLWELLLGQCLIISLRKYFHYLYIWHADERLKLACLNVLYPNMFHGNYDQMKFNCNGVIIMICFIHDSLFSNKDILYRFTLVLYAYYFCHYIR